jgi:hypothetical protein
MLYITDVKTRRLNLKPEVYLQPQAKAKASARIDIIDTKNNILNT